MADYRNLGQLLMPPGGMNNQGGQSQMPSQAPAWGMRNQLNPQGQQYGQAAAHMPSQANAYGMRGTTPPMSQPAQPRQPMGGTMASGGDNMHAFADGGVVAPNDPVDAQLEARRLLARQGYPLGLGGSSAGLPPSVGSEYFTGPTMARVGGRDIPISRPRDDGLSDPAGHLDASAIGTMLGKARTAAEESSYIPSKYRNLPRHADGGVVAPQPPSRLQALWQALMGRNVLQQAAGPSQAPPPPPPPEMQDTSIVRKAAEDAARRMQAEKAAQGKPQMYNGGIVR